MATSRQRATVLRRLGWLAAGSLLAVSALGAPAGVSAATGSVWTTRETCLVPDVDQNTNSYMVFETVHIRGTGFDPGTYDWDITATGKGGATIASGQVVITSTDDFCLEAVNLQPAHEGGPYQATVGDKHDNFSVKGTAETPQPSPTPTPNPTPTPTPGGGGAGSTLPPTDALSGSKGGSDSLGLVLMLLAGLLASVMVLTPARARRR